MPGVAVVDPDYSFTYLTDRHLAVLRTTYPAWQIFHIVGGPLVHEWTASLLPDLTDEMRAAGVVRSLSRPDSASLASALAEQVPRLHAARASTWPYEDSPAVGG